MESGGRSRSKCLPTLGAEQKRRLRYQLERAEEAVDEELTRYVKCGAGWCSFFSLNLFAAGLHAVWVLVFCLLWALDKRDNGEHRDIVYPLHVGYSLWFQQLPKDAPRTAPTSNTSLPVPSSVLPAARTPVFVAGGKELVGGDVPNPTSIFSPVYETCERPKPAMVGTMTVSPSWADAELTLSLHWIVVSFFALSALFQGSVAVLDATGLYPYREGVMARGTNWLRFLEYSFSASLMVVAIALQIGLTDAWMLFALAALTWVTQVLGGLAELTMATELDLMRTADDAGASADKIRRGLATQRWAAHFAGWITQGAVFVVLLAHFFESQGTCEYSVRGASAAHHDERRAPDFVYAIVFAELVLFVGFGVTQTAQFALHDAGRNFFHAHVERAYVVQSLVSKTILGWLVYGGNFAPN